MCVSVAVGVSCAFSLTIFFHLFALFYLIYFITAFQMPVCFLTRERKGVDLDGRGGWEDLGGVGEGKSLSEYTV